MSVLKQLLENILSYDRPKRSIGHLLDELSNPLIIISQFIDKFIRTDSSVINSRLNIHSDVIFGDDLLRSQSKDICLHVYLYHIFADRVYDVEPGFDDFEETTKRLVHSHFGSLDLVDRRITAATYTRTPYSKASA